MAILEQYVSKGQVGNRVFSLIKSAFTQFSTQGSVKNKNSKLIGKIIDSVESNSSWLNIKRYRKNIKEIKIKMGDGIEQDKGECALVEVHYNLKTNRRSYHENSRISVINYCQLDFVLWCHHSSYLRKNCYR